LSPLGLRKQDALAERKVIEKKSVRHRRRIHMIFRTLFYPGIALLGGMLCSGTFDEPGVAKRPVIVNAEVTDAASKTALQGEVPASPLNDNQVSADEDAIRQVDDRFTKAWEAGDAKAAAAQFTEHAEYVDESGTVFAGRAAIENCLSEFFEDNPACKLKMMIDAVRIISPGVAVVDGRSLVTISEALAPVQCHFTSVYVKTDGEWLTASIRDRVPRNLREHSVQLQQLDWLKGDWIDEGDDSIVTFSCESIDNGNFLIRKFSIELAGQEAMTGTQRIGWDPLTGKLRTWIFDSEGAYGEGLWHRDDANDRWILKSAGVMADGQAASSTSIYTFVNEHTMTWQSVDHEIAGIQQPDSEIFTIVRVAPSPVRAIADEESATR